MNRSNIADIETYPDILSLKEVSEILRISQITLRRWDNKGLLKAFRPTKTQQRRYLKKDVANFLQPSLLERLSPASTSSPLEKTFETEKEYIKANGEHYTPEILASFVAKKIAEAIGEKVSDRLKILDPAVGDGELLLPLAALMSASCKHGLEISGFDIKNEALAKAKDRLARQSIESSSTFVNANFLEFALNPNNQNNFDIIISNPPYVRTQVMGSAQSQALASQFDLGGRVDLYYAFLDGMAKVLKPDGIAGVIVSNKFMKTKSGADVRTRLLQEFDILHVWDFGDTQLFEAAVLPCVLLLKKKGSISKNDKSKFTTIYSSRELDDSTPIFKNVVSAVEHAGKIKVEDKIFEVLHGYLAPENPSDVWKLSTEKGDEWLQRVKQNTWKEFQDLGKIRVGVKTTADSVFIREDWDSFPTESLPELLKPLTTHGVARQFKQDGVSSAKILYTHEIRNGKRCPVDIEKYPKSKKYLMQHEEQLTSRKYVIEAGRSWYEIWVPHSPDLWVRPKIIFRDIVKEPTFWMDVDGSIVNGDCYWMTLDQETDMDLLWLTLGVGNSKFIEDFYDHKFNNKIYAGRRRFMTQYVKQFPLPNPKTEMAKEIIATSKKIFDLLPSNDVTELKQALDGLVCSAFGVS
ncbi:MAG: N-6 DNA methylase [Patescibacteria group bacterium]